MVEVLGHTLKSSSVFYPSSFFLITVYGLKVFFLFQGKNQKMTAGFAKIAFSDQLISPFTNEMTTSASDNIIIIIQLS